MIIKRKIVFCFLFLVFWFLVFLWQGIFLPKNPLGQEMIFSVEKGQNLFEVAKNLEKEGIIKNRILFDFYVFIKGDQGELKAGKYALNPSMNAAEVAQKIISGDTAKIIVTIPEGFTVKQIEERLNLKLPGENLEGFLFPDTYQFPIGVTAEEAVKKMRDNFEKKLTPYLNEISDKGLTLSQIITMASLVEKEVKTKEEKELVSDVLWKRLKIGMALQVDAAMDTYKYRGLPASPICNPGLESILAAIYPKESPYWYYLSSSDGKTYFSETLEQHNIKKAKYLTK